MLSSSGNIAKEGRSDHDLRRDEGIHVFVVIPSEGASGAVVEGSAVWRQWKILRDRGEPQIPPLGLKSSVGMTMREEFIFKTDVVP